MRILNYYSSNNEHSASLYSNAGYLSHEVVLMKYIRHVVDTGIAGAFDCSSVNQMTWLYLCWVDSRVPEPVLIKPLIEMLIYESAINQQLKYLLHSPHSIQMNHLRQMYSISFSFVAQLCSTRSVYGHRPSNIIFLSQVQPHNQMANVFA